MKVDVYRNLRKSCMSVRSRERSNYGRVVAHANYLLLHNCQFVVNEKGQQKVLSTKNKNVHAFVRGRLKTGYGNFLDVIGPNPLTSTASEILSVSLDGWVQLTYNPYHNSTFVRVDTKQPVVEARMVLIRENKVFAHTPS